MQPTYKASKANAADDAEAADVSDDTDASTWTYDWKADMDRGVALGQHYKAIGDAIDAHYREAFDPTYAPAAESNEDEDSRRNLKTKEKKQKPKRVQLKCSLLNCKTKLWWS